MDPATALLIASAVKAAIAAAQKKKEGKRKAKQEKSETYGELLNEAHNRRSRVEEEGLKSHASLGSARAKALRETAAHVRGSL